MPSIYSVSKVVYLNVQPSEGNEVCQINDYELNEKSNTVTIPLSQTLLANKKVHIGITLGCLKDNNLVNFIEENNKKYNVTKMTKEEMDALRDAICVNRQ